MRFLTAVLTSLSILNVVYADPTPNEPAPGNVFIQGQNCNVGWAADTTGQWKQMVIELKTGDNFNMVSLMTVGTVDGTDPTKTTFTYPCPTVSPHSPIYFYQFSQAGSANNYWTGRFTITDNQNDIVPPAQSTQPGGELIPWGTGQIVGASGGSSIPPPVTSSVTGSGSSAGAPPPTASIPTTIASSSSSGSGSSGSGTGSSGSSSVITSTASGVDTGAPTPTTTNSNGASSGVSSQGFLGRVAVALGAAAFASLL